MANVHSDTMGAVVLITGVTVMTADLIIFCLVLFMRSQSILMERHRKRVRARWTPLLAGSLTDNPGKLPTNIIRPHDVWSLLHLWNYFQESVRGDAKDKLNDVARLVGMDRVARRMLEKGVVAGRLMAVATLGHLRERSAWKELQDIASGENSFLSLAAARALVHIDPKSAISFLTPFIASRTDWSPAKVATILNEAGADLIAKPLAEAVLAAGRENGTRLIRYLERARCTAALPFLRETILPSSPDDQVIAASLHLFGQFADPIDLEIVRANLQHPNWHVRLEAVAALGKMGTQEDEARIIGMLSDEEWCVRYRTAESLANLPFMNRQRLSQIQAEQTDAVARDILTPFLFSLEGLGKQLP